MIHTLTGDYRTPFLTFADTPTPCGGFLCYNREKEGWSDDRETSTVYL